MKANNIKKRKERELNKLIYKQRVYLKLIEAKVMTSNLAVFILHIT